MINGKIILPNSKIIVHIPMYHLYHDIDVENNGHGVIPDYPTIYKKEETINGIDADMRKVLELVN